MSPQLALVLLVALVTASLAGLFTRAPFWYLPLYWLLGVSGLLIGQTVGRVLGWGLLSVGQVRLGAGLLVNLALIASVQLFTLWYNQPRSR